MVSSTPLLKPAVYESKQIKLTGEILHIGAYVSELTPLEFFQMNGRIYVPNLDVLARAFKEAKPQALKKANPFERAKFGQKQNPKQQTNGMLDKFVEIISSRDRRALRELLEEAFGSEWWHQKDSLGNSVFPEVYISEDWVDHTIDKMRPMIRDGFGRLYIPGSSIKGAIRTAIAYCLLKKDSTKISEIELALKERLVRTFPDREKKKIATDLFMANLFSDYTLTYQQQKAQGKTSPPNTDIMRAVKISDSSSLVAIDDFNRPIVSEVVISSYLTKNDTNLAKEKDGSPAVEMVHNIQTEFTFTLDKNDDGTGMLSWFQDTKNIGFPQSVEDILSMCKKFAQSQWEHERSYWNRVENNQDLDFGIIREFYSDEACPYDLRLGWASGMMGTTVDLLFKPELRTNIRNACGMPAGNYEAPKSRRTAVGEDGAIQYPMGWVKLEVL